MDARPTKTRRPSSSVSGALSPALSGSSERPSQAHRTSPAETLAHSRIGLQALATLSGLRQLLPRAIGRVELRAAGDQSYRSGQTDSESGSVAIRPVSATMGKRGAALTRSACLVPG